MTRVSTNSSGFFTLSCIPTYCSPLLFLSRIIVPTKLAEEAIIADAEKAFVSMLDAKYNEVKFRNYPKGGDGLYDKGLQGYIYGINYDMKLVTKAAEFAGKYGRCFERDCILVKGDDVEILKVDD